VNVGEGERKQKQRTTSRRDEAKAESQEPQNDAPPADGAPAGEDAPQGGGTTPPPPPTENEDESAPAGETYSKELLITRAPRLLGYSSALTRGVLAEADENLTIEQAKARIQQFLDQPVANEEA
jgi:hypothetical protein